MNEGTVTTEVLKDLRSNIRGAVVIKTHDFGTAGIPDIHIGWADRACWSELKYLGPKDTLKKKCKSQQLITCHELATVNNGRSWVVVFEDPAHIVTVWQPRVLFRHLWPNVAGAPDHPGWLRHDQSPVELDNLEPPAGLAGVLHSCGAFRAPWSYEIVTRLVKDSIRA